MAAELACRPRAHFHAAQGERPLVCFHAPQSLLQTPRVCSGSYCALVTWRLSDVASLLSSLSSWPESPGLLVVNVTRERPWGGPFPGSCGFLQLPGTSEGSPVTPATVEVASS